MRLYRLKERRRHRFARCFVFQIYAYHSTCNLSLGFAFLYRREEENTEKLDLERRLFPAGGGSVSYVVEDRACITSKQGQVGGALHAAYGDIINDRPRLVDKWHFRAHSRNDPVRYKG